jgi:glycosyltransferase involved in cell wall biosynthesis
MKIIFLHPPLYPVNIKFLNVLGEHCNLKVIIFGEYPLYHPSWNINILRDQIKTFKFNVYGEGHLKKTDIFNPIFLKEIVNENIDIVVSIDFWPPSFYISLLKRLFRVKVFIFSESIKYTQSKFDLIRTIYRKILVKLVDGFIAASPDTVNYLQSILPHKRYNNIYLSVHTIDVCDWIKKYTEIDNKENLRKKWNIPYDKLVILGVGNLIKKKNWSSVIKILSNLKDNIVFVLVGEGDDYSNLRKLAENISKGKRIFFMGKRENKELLELYKLSDIFVFPSLYDQFGYVVPEALASSLPVICSKNAGARCLIKDGYNGFLIDPNEDFSEKINKTVQNLELMRKNAFESIRKFTIENRVKKLVKHFNEFVKKGNK